MAMSIREMQESLKNQSTLSKKDRSCWAQEDPDAALRDLYVTQTGEDAVIEVLLATAA